MPSITFISATPQSVTEYADSLTIVIGYEDGDGDLGTNDADIKNLFVTDSRNQVVYEYRVKQLAPNNSTIAITGTLSVVIDKLGLVNGSTPETATFEILVMDRAGNKSNIVSTTPIIINP